MRSYTKLRTAIDVAASRFPFTIFSEWGGVKLDIVLFLHFLIYAFLQIRLQRYYFFFKYASKRTKNCIFSVFFVKMYYTNNAFKEQKLQCKGTKKFFIYAKKNVFFSKKCRNVCMYAKFFVSLQAISAKK